jgi:hypothetical protein
VLCYEPADRISTGIFDIPDELRHLGEGFVHTAKIAAFMRYPKPFPVDIRHNAKIGREALAAWAAQQPLKDKA